MRTQLAQVALLSFGLFACREEIANTDYSAYQDVFDRLAEGQSPDISGVDPFEDGDQRAGFDPGYEGESTETITPGIAGGQLFIFENTLTLNASGERVEGGNSILVTLTGAGGFWGFGWFYEELFRNLSDYQTLSIALNSADGAFDDIDLIMADAVTDATVQASDYGYVNDGEWYQLFIPLQDFVDQGISLSSLTNVLSLVNQRTSTGEDLLVDNLYFDADTPEKILADIAARQSE